MYSPNNSSVYTAVYTAALAAMNVSSRPFQAKNVIGYYTDLASVAGAFAQAYDTVWGNRLTNSLDIELASLAVEALWETTSPPTSAVRSIPATYTDICNALIAMNAAARAYYAGQGVIPTAIANVDIIPTITFKPGTPSDSSTVATWAEVETFITAHLGNVVVYVDDSLAVPTVPATAITECYGLVTFKAIPTALTFVPGNYLVIEDGGRIRNPHSLDGVIVSSAPTIRSPIYIDLGSDFGLNNAALLYLAAGATVPMVEYAVSAGFGMTTEVLLDNSAAPAVPAR